MIYFSPTSSVKDETCFAPLPKWALGTMILAVSLERVELRPARCPYLVYPRSQGHLLWAAALEGSSLILLPILSCHPSVCQSLCGSPPAPYKILVFTGRPWSQLRSGSPAPPTRWALALSPFVLVQKEAGQGWGGVPGLAGVCRCPGSQHGE